jgi:DNA-binding transcriptional MerR regulator
MKISELAKHTGISKETIHYYVREGLVSAPKKLGKNIARYDEICIEQIRIIKRLQDNYFLPLSVIKKIIKRHQEKSNTEYISVEILSEFLKPLDYLLAKEVPGEENYRKITGLGRKWREKMEQWGVITAMSDNGEAVYSQDDVIIGKLIVEMDQMGYGPKDGTDPEDLRRIADFIRDYIINSQKKFFNARRKELSPRELKEKEVKIREIMSLFFYHLYRKLVRESTDLFEDFQEDKEGKR